MQTAGKLSEEPLIADLGERGIVPGGALSRCVFVVGQDLVVGATLVVERRFLAAAAHLVGALQDVGRDIDLTVRGAEHPVRRNRCVRRPAFGTETRLTL